MEGSDAFDLSSVYFTQHFSKSVTLLVGKINMMDIAAVKPFMGGAGIDSFWNLTFAAPPSGLVPPYLFGALLSVRTEPANFGLWIYDPDSVINKSGFEDPFENGVTIRASVDIPVTIGGLSGHQGLLLGICFLTLPALSLPNRGWRGSRGRKGLIPFIYGIKTRAFSAVKPAEHSNREFTTTFCRSP
jgi:hypothetical protein